MIKNGMKKPFMSFASEFSQVMGAPLKDKTNDIRQHNIGPNTPCVPSGTVADN